MFDRLFLFLSHHSIVFQSINYLYSKNSVVIELKRCLHLLDFVIKNICKSGVINQAGEMAARFMDFRVFECYRRFE